MLSRIKRIIVIDYGEYRADDIKKIQIEISKVYPSIKLLLDPDKVLAIASITYSVNEIIDIFMEAFTDVC